ncbi:hypothetical protein DV704_01255 [Meiothermus sp. QL-1]|uniref:hypothetical protein n=1 Tax=Meiothermus sp. QL-1 TaxID=2058095 RepID=UPI000E0B33CF|nr:hypothetical protein [Meiothermus sp. QL-1]RDI96477.1 hypothetical protein DV704_01255 [Meiothermus sp. QL-1]
MLEEAPPKRQLGEVTYALLLSAPRLVAEGIRARLEQKGIPVHLETPFLGLPEAYLGVYTGQVGLWIPEAFYREAVLILERDAQGETP